MCDTVIKRVEAHWNVVSVSDTMYIDIHGENDSLLRVYRVSDQTSDTSQLRTVITEKLHMLKN